MRRSVSVACVLVLVLIAWGAYANQELIQLQTDDKQWVMPGKDYSATRFSTLNQITRDNVKNLRPAWTFSTGTLRGHEGAPLVIGDTMYVHTSFPNNVYALDLKGPDVGQIKWKYLPKQDPSVQAVACCDNVNRGLSYADGKVFLNQLDGTLVALDAKTGKEAWKAENADPKVGATMTGAPHVMKDKVIVGVSGGEFGVRGHVTAYDIKTGQRVWRAYSMGPDEEILLADDFNKANPHFGQKNQGVATWQGDQWTTGGGTTWGWYAFDPALNLMYYGTGNPSTWNPSQRPGDNKWSMTIFARDVDTGKAKWGYQMTPRDAWDYDGVNEMILADLTIGGKPVKALVHFDRNGLHARPHQRHPARRREVRSRRQLGDARRQTDGATRRGRCDADAGRQELAGRLPGGARLQGSAAGGVLAADEAVLCPHQSRLHGLRAVRGEVHRGTALRRRDVADVPRTWRAHGRLHRLGRRDGQDRVEQQGTVLGVEWRARHRH